MAEFKENLTQREEINIKPDNQGQMFDKSNLYKSQLAVMDSYSNISQNLFTNIDKVNNQQKNILSNKKQAAKFILAAFTSYTSLCLMDCFFAFLF